MKTHMLSLLAALLAAGTVAGCASTHTSGADTAAKPRECPSGMVSVCTSRGATSMAGPTEYDMCRCERQDDIVRIY